MVHCLLVKIVNHFVNHSTIQNDKVKIDYPLTLEGPNRLVQINTMGFFTLAIFGIFLLKIPIKKTMNCSSEMITKFVKLWHNKSR